MAKPHPMIEKAMQVVCALKGFKNLNWVTARDLLSRNSLKVELKQLNANNLKPEDVLRAQNVLIDKTNSMLTPENLQMHSQGAALLLIWAANLIKNYAAFKFLGDELKLHKEPYKNLKASNYNQRDL